MLGMYMVAAIAVCFGIGILVYLYLPRIWNGNTIIRIPEDTTKSTTCEFRRALDGVCVEGPAKQNPKLVAVMVENHFESWPQSGVAAARVVYEAPLEGNITRFLLLFTEDQEVEKVGPVRSARPYYLDWLLEYGTPQYMHVGGSPDALQRISTEGINNLNEFNRGWYYWRDTGRYAPHNTYTSSQLWQDALDSYQEQYTTTSFQGWTFGDIAACTEQCMQKIQIPYATGNTYTASWTYVSSTEQYLREQAGSADVDTDGAQIVADTVIIQSVDSRVLDSAGRLEINTVGKGEVRVFQKGTMIVGEWKKESVSQRTIFYDAYGEEIVLNPGKIWVQIINKDTVTYE